MRDCTHSERFGPDWWCSITKQECIRETGKLCPLLIQDSKAKPMPKAPEPGRCSCGKTPHNFLREFSDELSEYYGDGSPASTFCQKALVWSEMQVRGAIVKAQKEFKK